MNAAEAAVRTINTFPVPVQIAVYLSMAAGTVGAGAAIYKAVQNGCKVEYEFVDGRKVSFSTNGNRNEDSVVVDASAEGVKKSM